MSKKITKRLSEEQVKVVEMCEEVWSEDISQMLKMEAKHAVLRMGLQLLQEEVESMCGPKYSRKKDNEYRRGGSESSYLIYEGSKEKIIRPRVRDESGEVALKNLEKMQNQDLMDKEIEEKLLLGISTRNYSEVVSDWSDKIGISKSSISRAFKRASEEDLNKINTEDLSNNSFVALMIDGFKVAGETVIVALGIDQDLNKIPVGLIQGHTENGEVVKDLLANIVERNFNLHCEQLLIVMDGSKALASAVKDTWGKRALIQRCWIHKYRNIKGYLPEKYHPELRKRLKKMVNLVNFTEAVKQYNALKSWLGRISLAAKKSLEEAGLSLLTLQKLKLPAIFFRSLNTTNAIESFISVIRHLTRNVKRWFRINNQILRWTAAAITQAQKNMKRISGVQSKQILFNSLNNLEIHKMAA